MISSRERCYKAVKREEVDLIPINIWLDPEPLRNLTGYLNIKDVEDLLQHFNIDYRGFLPTFYWLEIGLKGGFKEESFIDSRGSKLHKNIFGVISASSEDGLTSMYVDYPLEHVEVENYPFPEVDEESFEIVEKARKK
ncbi:MAG: hypothetical protein ACUVQ8_08780, partial [Nitrososphaeria archaeon]